jgi:hypothetical protein
MAAKKQSKSKSQHAGPAAPAAGAFANRAVDGRPWHAQLTAVIVTSGSVLVFLLTAKRFL